MACIVLHYHSSNITHTLLEPLLFWSMLPMQCHKIPPVQQHLAGPETLALSKETIKNR